MQISKDEAVGLRPESILKLLTKRHSALIMLGSNHKAFGQQAAWLYNQEPFDLSWFAVLIYQGMIQKRCCCRWGLESSWQ